jgi:hypothetical protein
VGWAWRVIEAPFDEFDEFDDQGWLVTAVQR